MQSLDALRNLRTYSAQKKIPEINDSKTKKTYSGLPNEILWEIMQFLKVKECAKIATVSVLFYQLTVPRMRVGLQVLKEKIEQTKEKLQDTNKEIAVRQEQIAVLNGQIGDMNGRLTEMGDRLYSMNSIIVNSHERIDNLMLKLRKLREDFENDNYENNSTYSEN